MTMKNTIINHSGSGNEPYGPILHLQTNMVPALRLRLFQKQLASYIGSFPKLRRTSPGLTQVPQGIA